MQGDELYPDHFMVRQSRPNEVGLVEKFRVVNFMFKKKKFNFQSSFSLEPVISDPGEGPGTGQGRRGQGGQVSM